MKVSFIRTQSCLRNCQNLGLVRKKNCVKTIQLTWKNGGEISSKSCQSPAFEIAERKNYVKTIQLFWENGGEVWPMCFKKWCQQSKLPKSCQEKLREITSVRLDWKNGVMEKKLRENDSVVLALKSGQSVKALPAAAEILPKKIMWNRFCRLGRMVANSIDVKIIKLARNSNIDFREMQWVKSW